MSKFHINKHGVPAPCKATKGNCPYGGESGNENHFDTQEEAQAHVNSEYSAKYGALPVTEANHEKEPKGFFERGVGVGDPALANGAIPEYYAKYDDAYEFFYDSVETYGPGEFGGQGFKHLEDEEKYEIYTSGYDADEYLSHYNEGYNEKHFDKSKDDIANYAVEKGMYQNRTEFEADVAEDGKEETFKKFNKFLFTGKSEGRPEGTGVFEGSGVGVGDPALANGAIPEYYAKYEDARSVFEENMLEYGPENFDDRRYEFENLDLDEQYDVYTAHYSKSDYLKDYNDSYEEKHFDRMKDTMGSYAAENGLYDDKDGFDKDIEKNGKEATFRKFNNFLFNGK